MITLFLSFVLNAAPIPETNGEGHIAMILEDKNHSELIVLSPSGKELNRVELKDLDGHVVFVRTSSSGKLAVISTQRKETTRVGKIGLFYYGIYTVALNRDAKPVLLNDQFLNAVFVLNHAGTHLYIEDIDLKKTAASKSGEIKYQSWKIDLKTKEKKTIPIPDGYSIIDISRDESTFLAIHLNDDKRQEALIPTKTMKPEFLFQNQNILESTRGMNHDGSKLFKMDHSLVKGKDTYRPVIYDVKTKSKTEIVLPRKLENFNVVSVSPSEESIVLVDGDRNLVDIEQTKPVSIYTCNIDGSNPKKIFQSQKGQRISSIDWR